MRLIQVPRAAGLAAALGAQACIDEGREAELPGPDRLVGDFIAALAEQLGDIAEAEFVAEAPEDCQQDDSVGNWRSLKASRCVH